jgi:hypothetical protein
MVVVSKCGDRLKLLGYNRAAELLRMCDKIFPFTGFNESSKEICLANLQVSKKVAGRGIRQSKRVFRKFLAFAVALRPGKSQILMTRGSKGDIEDNHPSGRQNYNTYHHDNQLVLVVKEVGSSGDNGLAIFSEDLDDDGREN